MRLVNRLWAVLVFTSACASGPGAAPPPQQTHLAAPAGAGKGAPSLLADAPPPAAAPAPAVETPPPPEKDGQFIRALSVNEGLRATAGSAALAPQDNPKLMLGRGIDFITLEAKGDCIVRTAPGPGGGGESLFAIEEITSHEELSSKMDVSASASLRFSVMKGGSMKMKYVEERKVSHYATYVLVRAIVRAAPGLVIIDEAYEPFAGRSWATRINEFPNVLIMRTLSKIGLAGVRLGYLFGAPEWINEIDKVRAPFNVSVVQQVAATVILDHYDELKRHAALMVAERERLFVELQKLPGVTPFPSKANFVLARFPDSALVFDALKTRGILVRNLSAMHPLMANTLRISVGIPAEMDALIKALKEIL